MPVNDICRRYYQSLPVGPPVQGDIFSGLPLNLWDNETISALIITPKCDLAHHKSTVVNYLPIIPIDEYIEREGYHALLDEYENKLKNKLSTPGSALGILDLLELSAGSEVISIRINNVKAAAHESKKPKLERAHEEVTRILLELSAIEAARTRGNIDFEDLIGMVTLKAVNTLKRQIITNQKADLYFIPPIEDIINKPSVVYLRFIGTCSLNLLQSALTCLSHSSWQKIYESCGDYDVKMCPTKPERLARLVSPYIESLMARFASLFSRVGVRDLQPEEINEFLGED